MEGLIIFSFIVISFILLLTLVLLLGPRVNSRSNFFGRLYGFLFEEFVNDFKALLVPFIGRKQVQTLERVYSYVIFEANPLLQGLYIVLLTTGVLTFCLKGWNKIPETSLSAFHYYMIPVMIIITYASFGLVSFSNPGIITTENSHIARKHYEYDYVIHEPKECRTCHFLRPARSKHCSRCNVCVGLFDHHCIWVNNCIGQNNHHYFVLFLGVTLCISLYAAYIVAIILLELGIPISWNDGIDRRDELDWIDMLVLVIDDNPLLFSLGVFAFSIAVILTFFIGMHMYTISSGTTTNESVQWARLCADIMKGRCYMTKAQLDPTEATVVNVQLDHVRRRKVLKDDRLGVGNEDLIKVQSAKQIRNIYDRGVWRNILDALTPVDM